MHLMTQATLMPNLRTITSSQIYHLAQQLFSSLHLEVSSRTTRSHDFSRLMCPLSVNVRYLSTIRSDVFLVIATAGGAAINSSTRANNNGKEGKVKRGEEEGPRS